jgi:hypothetical protein
MIAASYSAPSMDYQLPVKRRKKKEKNETRVGRHDTQHNETQLNDTQHNETQLNDTQHNDTQYNDIQQLK